MEQQHQEQHQEQQQEQDQPGLLLTSAASTNQGGSVASTSASSGPAAGPGPATAASGVRKEKKSVMRQLLASALATNAYVHLSAIPRGSSELQAVHRKAKLTRIHWQVVAVGVPVTSNLPCQSHDGIAEYRR